MGSATSGYLLIADITGYTQYLSASELDHAQGTLTALLEVLLDQTRPPLVLSRLAGDAVIGYALGDAFATGQTFVELIENTYVAFQLAIERMVLNNTCECTACANVGSLDLKFFVHWGTFARQTLSAHEELLGNDVNLLHRLLKNRVVEATGIRAYALYTQSAIDHLGLDGLTDTMVAHRESYEHLGEVGLWVADMAPVWARRRSATRRAVVDVAVECSTEVAMEPASVWDFLISPTHLRTLLGATSVGLTERAGGRVVPGSVYHCFHGSQAIGQTVVEWTPFQRIVMESALPRPLGSAVMDVEYVLEPTAIGTRLTQRLAKARGPWLARNLASLFIQRMIGRSAQRDLHSFKAYIEGEHGRRGAADETSATPPADR